jgi:hypothetical protein
MATNAKIDLSEVKTEVKQVTKQFSDKFESNFTWKIENFMKSPAQWILTEKIGIPRTQFYWFVYKFEISFDNVELFTLPISTGCCNFILT